MRRKKLAVVGRGDGGRVCEARRVDRRGFHRRTRRRGRARKDESKWDVEG